MDVATKADHVAKTQLRQEGERFCHPSRQGWLAG
jgi:hypothetical protein